MYGYQCYHQKRHMTKKKNVLSTYTASHLWNLNLFLFFWGGRSIPGTSPPPKKIHQWIQCIILIINYYRHLYNGAHYDKFFLYLLHDSTVIDSRWNRFPTTTATVVNNKNNKCHTINMFYTRNTTNSAFDRCIKFSSAHTKDFWGFCSFCYTNTPSTIVIINKVI